MNIPSILPKKDLKHIWYYRDQKSRPIALVARYQSPNENSKKWYHQYRLEGENWVEGVPSLLPIFGLDVLHKIHSEASVYILEGEKCAQAAHYLGLTAVTSMMGSSQAQKADWAILASYRQNIKRFVLIPDNDKPGEKYMEEVYHILQKLCPTSELIICPMPSEQKGSDLVDWILNHKCCPSEWDGFGPFDEPHNEYLKNSLEAYVEENKVEASKYFESNNISLQFEGEPLPIEVVHVPVLPCPIDTLPLSVREWISTHAEQMQIPPDFLIVPFLVTVGSLLGRKRALKLRQGTDWYEHANLWGMVIGDHR